MFKRRDNKTIMVSNIKKEEYIDVIIDQILLLFCFYKQVKDKFNKLCNIKVEEEKVFKYYIWIYSFKEEFLELFISWYVREYFIKSTIITKLEDEKYKFEEGPTMRYHGDVLIREYMHVM